MRLAADAAHQFGGIELDRSTPLRFKLNGRPIDGFAGDTVLTATLAAGIDGYGTLGETPIGLTDRFSPLVVSKQMPPLPMDLVPAIDGAELSSVGPHKRKWFGREPTLGHRLDSLPDAPWLRDEPARTLEADLLVIGAGVAGLAAADAAAADGHRVLLVERHPWLGGDARYFGPVGDVETPETVIARLSAQPVLPRAIYYEPTAPHRHHRHHSSRRRHPPRTPQCRVCPGHRAGRRRAAGGRAARQPRPRRSGHRRV